MKKIGICGHYNFGSEAIGGQTIKTRIITEELSKHYGEDNILLVDTEEKKSNPIKFLFRCVLLLMKSKNIIILPAANGVKFLLPVFVLFSKIFKKKLHYIIVGAWLPTVIDNNKLLSVFIKKIDYIYAQTGTLISNLRTKGLSNLYLMNNFKDVDIVSITDLPKQFEKPYKLCILSRINYQKGVEAAISVVNRINKISNEKTVQLDIYGPVEEKYKDRFNELLIRNKSIVTYKGVIDYNKTIDVIKNYYLLLFPTKYYTEGLPGTILDAFYSGVPVLASKWESWQDIITEGITGFTYNFDDEEDFFCKLQYLIDNNEVVVNMKERCVVEADKYKPEKSVQILINNLA